jgi:sulfite exporter TauE/SafE
MNRMNIVAEKWNYFKLRNRTKIWYWISIYILRILFVLGILTGIISIGFFFGIKAFVITIGSIVSGIILLLIFGMMWEAADEKIKEFRD